MSSAKYRRITAPLAALVLMFGMGLMVSACSTIAGAGQDVSAIGHTVTNASVRTQQATHAP